MGAAGNITAPVAPVAPKSPQAGAAAGTTTLDAARKARLAKAVKDFEAIFLGMMMKSMRSSIPKDDGSGESFGGDIMETMFDEEVARQMAGRSNLGLADMMYRSITHEPMPPAQAPAPAGGNDGRAPERLSPAPVGGTVSPAPTGLHSAQGASSTAPGEMPHAQPTPAAAPVPAKKTLPGSAPSFAPPKTVRERIAAYENLIQEAAAYHGVDSTVIKAVMAAESGGERTAVSSRDAKGLMQLTDSTAADMGVRNVWNARENIQGGARYLQSLLQRFDGDTRNAVASYNAGPARVEKHGGVPPIPETQAYVRRVMNYIQYFAQEESSHEGR